MSAALPRSAAHHLLLISSSFSSSSAAAVRHSCSTRSNIPSPSCSLLRSNRSRARERHVFFTRRSASSDSLAAAGATDSPVEGAPAPVPDPVRESAGALDIRVGRVVRAWRHPEADSLYVEEVDVGEEEPRTICSGLVNYIPLDHLQDIKVVLLANLKPRNMRGVKSNGMLMAASDASHENVELLLPPEDSVPGERIWFGSEEEKDGQPEAATPNQVQKKKIWESVQPHLKTTDACVAVLSGIHPMRTSAGVIVSRSLKNANIS